MRILSTLTYYHPHWTGLSVVARRLAEGLADRGHEVTVLTSRHDPALSRRDRLNGVEIVRVPTRGRMSRTAVMPTFPFELARAVRQCDVVHLHTPMAESALVAVIARLFRKPMVITHHGDVVMPAGLVNGLIQRAMDGVIRLAMRLADAVVVHTADYRDHSRFLAPVASKIDAIFPPVVIPAPRRDDVTRWRRELDLEGRPIVGFAGRFVEEKGFDYLLEAVPLVRQQVPDVRFLFAGDTAIAYERFFDRCRPLLESQRDAVIELGLLTDPQKMADFYGMCDVFVLPSRTDTLAIVQIEAALAGTPLVVTDIPGAREVVRVTGAGVLVPPRDPRALAEGIVRVLDDPDRFREPLATVAEVFQPSRSVLRYEELVSTVASQR